LATGGAGGNGGNGGSGRVGYGGTGGSAGSGTGGDAGAVTVKNAGTIKTLGAGSDGIHVVTKAGTGVGGAGGAGEDGVGGSGGMGGVGGSGGGNGGTPGVAGSLGAAGIGTSGTNGAAGLGFGGSGGAVTIENSGQIDASGKAIHAEAIGPAGSNPIAITNSGVLKGGTKGIFASGPTSTEIVNTGHISATSMFAIDTVGASTAIDNAGQIDGFIDLTDMGDTFVNRSGGVFNARKTSNFRGGDDLFRNDSGGIVQAAGNGGAQEATKFVGLETFKNRGLISMIDNGVGDTFTIANTPGGKDLNYEGGGTLGVDAFLGGPGSKADVFTVQGNVSGVTKVAVNNTNAGPGALNTQGIRVVNVTGKTPNEGNFVLQDGPIDTGLFTYDLFFTPTGSGHWDLKSFAGAASHILPKLLTAAQDLWHETSSTWFDRTADLRVVLNNGGAPAYDAGGKSLGAPTSNGLTPGGWIKGGGSRLNRDDSVTTKAYGNSYTFDLDGQLDTIDLQMGLDMGRYDVLTQGDALIVGVLGGFVGGSLDYDALVRSFDFSGGQVGAYATYLNGGLFVDTLLNVHLYEIDAPNQGFPSSLDATTVGLRTDSGYRFGSFTGGAFFEPLATIEVTWADIDGFNVGGNRVSFSDDANVRGRLGARAGTTMQAWEGTMMEPFVIASLWGNLSDDNSATLVSNGQTFQFKDDLQDVWGEISAGVNLFNFSQTTAVFAKVDYTFGDDISGVGGKAGMRVSW